MKRNDPSAYHFYKDGIARRKALDYVIRHCSSRVLLSYFGAGAILVKYCNRFGYAKYQVFPANPIVERKIGDLIFSFNLKLASL